MEPRAVDDAGLCGQLPANVVDFRRDEPVLCRHDVRQHRQASHCGDRCEPAPHHLKQKLDGFDAPVMEVGMRIQLARQRQVASVAHRVRHVAVQIVDRGNRDTRPDQRTNGKRQIAFDVFSAVGDTGAMQGQQHAVNRQRSANAFEDVLLHGGIRADFDRARGRRLPDIGGNGTARINLLSPDGVPRGARSRLI